MKVDARNLLRLLRNKPRGMNAKELLLVMGHKQKKKTFLRKVLRAMAQEGWVIKDDNRYRLTPKAFEQAKKDGQTPDPRGAKIPPPQKNKEPQAYFTAQGTLLELGTGRVLELTEDSEQNFLPGDLLGFHLASSGQAKVTRFLERTAQLMMGRINEDENQQNITPFGPGFQTPFRLMGLRTHRDNDTKKALLSVLSYPEARARFKGFVSEGFLSGQGYQKILAENQIQTTFPPAVLHEAERLRFSAQPNRVDLRDKPFVTIDGEDAKDFDDAIYAETEESGWTLWVAIADVAHYVSPLSPLDKTAQTRGTSVYLPKAVVPMLPEKLSNELCSLKAGEPRLVLCAEMSLDLQGKPNDFKIYEAVIKVQHRLTYPQVDRLFETGDWNLGDEMKQRLLSYQQIAQILRNKRQKRGAINFSLPEVSFEFNDNEEVTGVHQTFQSESMKLVEQFMLEANENVGLYCAQNQLQVLWRNHQPPLPAKVEQLKSLLWNQNIRPGRLETPSDFNQLLKESQKLANPALVETHLLRTLSLAGYSGQRSGHFGLAATHYLHFTSPIRRYPDLVVHRSIKAFLQSQKRLKLPRWLADDTSQKEQQAKKAERGAVKLKRMSYMARLVGQAYVGRISGLSHQGVFCQLKEPFVEGYLPYNQIKDDRYLFDEKLGLARGVHRKRGLKIGQSVQILLTGIDLRYTSLNFTWIAWGEP